MREWVVSDHHFDHRNIIKYCNRPYTTCHDMNKDMIAKHNARVAKTDIVYMLGDLTMKGPEATQWLTQVIQQMHGIKHLVLGNHDKLKPFSYVDDVGFVSVHTSLILPKRANNRDIVMIHDPAAAQDSSKLWIHGHTHNNSYEGGEHLCNVSVEVTGYEPILLEAIVNGMRTSSANTKGDNHDTR